jgi:hypothetical protein
MTFDGGVGAIDVITIEIIVGCKNKEVWNRRRLGAGDFRVCVQHLVLMLLVIWLGLLVQS